MRYQSAHLVESVNPFGKQQTSIDLHTDAIIAKHLEQATGQVVYGYVSEESPSMRVLNEKGSFVVTCDPIDGSNVLDVNMSVASVFGIWHAKDLEGLTAGKAMVGACCCVYGSRTSMV